jgi:crossover junction endodeoxyribonuclease RusA
LILTMPWPPSALNPNARQHWTQLAKAKQSLRAAWAWEAKKQGAKPIVARALLVSLTFHPPDRRHRDLDNMLASIKAGLDGLADVLGVDDRHWRPNLARAEEIGGFVRVEVRLAE